MPKIKFRCLNCGKEVERYDNKPTKYCSAQCYAEHTKNAQIPKVCPVCGKNFLGKRAQIYCSKKCKRRHDYQYEIGEFEIVCPKCGKRRTAVKKPIRPTLCTKCRGIVARERTPAPQGEHSYAWKGGKRVDTYGYVKLHKPGHPFADSTNYVREHLYVACEAYGEAFIRENGGMVHHVNGDKQDNRLENLYVCTPEQNKRFTVDLLAIAYELVKSGIIQFNDGKYSCPLLSDETGEASQIR